MPCWQRPIAAASAGGKWACITADLPAHLACVSVKHNFKNKFLDNIPILPYRPSHPAPLRGVAGTPVGAGRDAAPAGAEQTLLRTPGRPRVAVRRYYERLPQAGWTRHWRTRGNPAGWRVQFARACARKHGPEDTRRRGGASKGVPRPPLSGASGASVPRPRIEGAPFGAPPPSLREAC